MLILMNIRETMAKIPAIRDIIAGFSLGRTIFIIFQRSSFVKIAKNRKKNQRYPEKENKRYEITQKAAIINITEVNFTLKVNPIIIPIIPKRI